jgi:hypothetical protein
MDQKLILSNRPEFQHYPLKKHSLKRVEKDGTRFYKIPTGDLVPSVTTVLQTFNKASLNAWIDRVGKDQANKIKNRAAARGTRMHECLERYMLGEIDPIQTDIDTIDLFNQIRPYIDNNVRTVYGIEHMMYSTKLRTAGTTDLICEYGNKVSIVDYKTSTRLKEKKWIESYFMQLTAYGIMMAELYKIVPEQVVVLIATDEGVGIEYKDNIENHIEKTSRFFKDYHSMRET